MLFLSLSTARNLPDKADRRSFSRSAEQAALAMRLVLVLVAVVVVVVVLISEPSRHKVAGDLWSACGRLICRLTTGVLVYSH